MLLADLSRPCQTELYLERSCLHNVCMPSCALAMRLSGNLGRNYDANVQQRRRIDNGGVNSLP